MQKTYKVVCFIKERSIPSFITGSAIERTVSVKASSEAEAHAEAKRKINKKYPNWKLLSSRIVPTKRRKRKA